MKIKIMATTRRVTHVFRDAAAWSLMFFSMLALADDMDARLDWAQLHYVSVPVEGFVEDVRVQPGQRVAKGEKLLQLNTALLSANVKQASARVAALQPVHADARREYNDAKTLYEQTVLSDVELQRAKMTYDITRAKLEEAEAKLAADKILLTHATQYAPWDAWVIDRRLESGQMIVGDERSKPLIILARADTMVAQAYITSEMRNQMVVGQNLQVRYQGKVYPAQILSLAMSSTQRLKDKTEAYAIRVRFAVNSETLLNPGDSATILGP